MAEAIDRVAAIGQVAAIDGRHAIDRVAANDGRDATGGTLGAANASGLLSCLLRSVARA